MWRYKKWRLGESERDKERLGGKMRERLARETEREREREEGENDDVVLAKLMKTWLNIDLGRNTLNQTRPK